MKVIDDSFGIGNGWTISTFVSQGWRERKVLTIHGMAMSAEVRVEGWDYQAIDFVWKGRMYRRRIEPCPDTERKCVIRARAFVKEIVGK